MHAWSEEESLFLITTAVAGDRSSTREGLDGLKIEAKLYLGLTQTDGATSEVRRPVITKIIVREGLVHRRSNSFMDTKSRSRW